MKVKTQRGLLVLLSLMLLSAADKVIAMDLDMTYEQEVNRMESQWQVLSIAYRSEKKGDLDSAILSFQQALRMGDQNVPRRALVRLYEKTGQFDKALEQVEWFLKGNQNEQGRQASLEEKQRLLKKMEGSI